MPHLHLGIIKGSRSPALQSNKPIWGEIFVFSMWPTSFFVQISEGLTGRTTEMECSLYPLLAVLESHVGIVPLGALQHSSLL